MISVISETFLYYLHNDMERERSYITFSLIFTHKNKWKEADANFPKGKTNLKHYPDLGTVVTRHQYGISALVPRTSFRGETSGRVTIFRLFSLINSRMTPFSLERGCLTRKTKYNNSSLSTSENSYTPFSRTKGLSTYNCQ